MVTTFQAPVSGATPPSPYNKKQEIDTKIPPKAKPIFNEISVNGVDILESEILHEAQNHRADSPGAALNEAARALVIRELLWQEAKSKNLLVKDSHLGQTEIDAAISALIDSEVTIPKATNEDCQRYYANNKQRFETGRLWEVCHILLADNNKDKLSNQQLLEKGKDIIAHLQQNPDDFAQYAKEFSACPSKEQGGNLGQIGRGSTVAEFEAALHNAKNTGLIPQPIASRYGYHIIYIHRIIKGNIMPYNMVDEKIAAWLESSSYAKATAQYINILAAKADITNFEL